MPKLLFFGGRDADPITQAEIDLVVAVNNQIADLQAPAQPRHPWLQELRTFKFWFAFFYAAAVIAVAWTWALNPALLGLKESTGGPVVVDLGPVLEQQFARNREVQGIFNHCGSQPGPQAAVCQHGVIEMRTTEILVAEVGVRADVSLSDHDRADLLASLTLLRTLAQFGAFPTNASESRDFMKVLDP